MAPPPEYDKEPKAPDKSATNTSCEETKTVHNLANDQPSNSDNKSASAAANAEVENNKLVETLDDGQLRALLDEAINYKCPKDREGKSNLFKELLEAVEQDEQAPEAAARGAGARAAARAPPRPARNRRALPHSNSMQDLVAALAAEPAPRRHRPAPTPAAPVSTRAIHGGSLPSGVDTSFLLSEEPTTGASYLATVRCVNPLPLSERRVSVSDTNASADIEMVTRRSKPASFPMTYTARATLEIQAPPPRAAATPNQVPYPPGTTPPSTIPIRHNHHPALTRPPKNKRRKKTGPLWDFMRPLSPIKENEITKNPKKKTKPDKTKYQAEPERNKKITILKNPKREAQLEHTKQKMEQEKAKQKVDTGKTKQKLEPEKTKPKSEQEKTKQNAESANTNTKAEQEKNKYKEKPQATAPYSRKFNAAHLDFIRPSNILFKPTETLLWDFTYQSNQYEPNEVSQWGFIHPLNKYKPNAETPWDFISPSNNETPQYHFVKPSYKNKPIETPQWDTINPSNNLKRNAPLQPDTVHPLNKYNSNLAPQSDFMHPSNKYEGDYISLTNIYKYTPNEYQFKEASQCDYMRPSNKYKRNAAPQCKNMSPQYKYNYKETRHSECTSKAENKKQKEEPEKTKQKIEQQNTNQQAKRENKQKEEPQNKKQKAEEENKKQKTEPEKIKQKLKPGKVYLEAGPEKSKQKAEQKIDIQETKSGNTEEKAAENTTQKTKQKVEPGKAKLEEESEETEQKAEPKNVKQDTKSENSEEKAAENTKQKVEPGKAKLEAVPEKTEQKAETENVKQERKPENTKQKVDSENIKQKTEPKKTKQKLQPENTVVSTSKSSMQASKTWAYSKHNYTERNDFVPINGRPSSDYEYYDRPMQERLYRLSPTFGPPERLYSQNPYRIETKKQEGMALYHNSITSQSNYAPAVTQDQTLTFNTKLDSKPLNKDSARETIESVIVQNNADGIVSQSKCATVVTQKHTLNDNSKLDFKSLDKNCVKETKENFVVEDCPDNIASHSEVRTLTENILLDSESLDKNYEQELNQNDSLEGHDDSISSQSCHGVTLDDGITENTKLEGESSGVRDTNENILLENHTDSIAFQCYCENKTHNLTTLIKNDKFNSESLCKSCERDNYKIIEDNASAKSEFAATITQDQIVAHNTKQDNTLENDSAGLKLSPEDEIDHIQSKLLSALFQRQTCDRKNISGKLSVVVNNEIIKEKDGRVQIENSPVVIKELTRDIVSVNTTDKTDNELRSSSDNIKTDEIKDEEIDLKLSNNINNWYGTLEQYDPTPVLYDSVQVNIGRIKSDQQSYAPKKDDRFKWTEYYTTNETYVGSAFKSPCDMKRSTQNIAQEKVKYNTYQEKCHSKKDVRYISDTVDEISCGNYDGYYYNTYKDRQNYRERVGNNIAYPKLEVNPRNIRSMTIGKPLPDIHTEECVFDNSDQPHVSETIEKRLSLDNHDKDILDSSNNGNAVVLDLEDVDGDKVKYISARSSTPITDHNQNEDVKTVSDKIKDIPARASTPPTDHDQTEDIKTVSIINETVFKENVVQNHEDDTGILFNPKVNQSDKGSQTDFCSSYQENVEVSGEVVEVKLVKISLRAHENISNEPENNLNTLSSFKNVLEIELTDDANRELQEKKSYTMYLAEQHRLYQAFQVNYTFQNGNETTSTEVFGPQTHQELYDQHECVDYTVHNQQENTPFMTYLAQQQRLFQALGVNYLVDSARENALVSNLNNIENVQSYKNSSLENTSFATYLAEQYKLYQALGVNNFADRAVENSLDGNSNNSEKVQTSKDNNSELMTQGTQDIHAEESKNVSHECIDTDLHNSEKVQSADVEISELVKVETQNENVEESRNLSIKPTNSQSEYLDFNDMSKKVQSSQGEDSELVTEDAQDKQVGKLISGANGPVNSVDEYFDRKRIENIHSASDKYSQPVTENANDENPNESRNVLYEPLNSEVSEKVQKVYEEDSKSLREDVPDKHEGETSNVPKKMTSDIEIIVSNNIKKSQIIKEENSKLVSENAEKSVILSNELMNSKANVAINVDGENIVSNKYKKAQSAKDDDTEIRRKGTQYKDVKAEKSKLELILGEFLNFHDNSEQVPSIKGKDSENKNVEESSMNGEKCVQENNSNNAYVILTLPDNLLNNIYNTDSTTLQIEHSINKKSKKKGDPAVPTEKKKEAINKKALQALLFENLSESDGADSQVIELPTASKNEVDATIPFSCITTPEVMANSNTTSSTAQSTVAVDPKSLEFRPSHGAVTSGDLEKSAPLPAPHRPPHRRACLCCRPMSNNATTPRSVVTSSFNGLPLSRPNYGSTATTQQDEFKKSLDENGNSVQGYGSPLSSATGSSQHKKPRRKKSSKNETVIKSHQIDGYQGNKDLNEVLRFIESNAENTRAGKLRKHKDDSDDKGGKKRSTERRKDKESKIKRATSLEELSRTKLEDLTDKPGKKERRNDTAPKAERRSWGDDARESFYYHEPEPQDADFQTVTKKRKPRRRADDSMDHTEQASSDTPRPARPPEPRARRVSAPPSDRSNDSNDDMDSVHSLPADAPKTVTHAAVSYADIARTRHNIPDLIESCNFYSEGGEEMLQQVRPDKVEKLAMDKLESAPSAVTDSAGYPALEPRAPRRHAPSSGPTLHKPAHAHTRSVTGKHQRKSERSESSSLPGECGRAPDVVAHRRPAVILLDAGRAHDMDGVTFGFDINEQLLGKHFTISDAPPVSCTNRPQIYDTSALQVYSASAPQVICSDEPQVYCASEPIVYCANEPHSLCSSDPQVYDTSAPQVICSDEPQVYCASEPKVYCANEQQVYSAITPQVYDTSTTEVYCTNKLQSVCESQEYDTLVPQVICSDETQIYCASEPKVYCTNEPHSLCTSDPQVYDTSAPQVYSAITPQVYDTSTTEVYCTNKPQSVCESQEYDINAPQVYSASASQSVCTSEPQIYCTNELHGPHTTETHSLCTSEPQLICTDEPQLYCASEPQVYCTNELQSVSASEPQVYCTNDPHLLCTSEPQVYNKSAPQSLCTSEPQVYVTNEPQSVCTSEPQIYCAYVSTIESKVYCAKEPQVHCASEPLVYDTSEPQSVCKLQVYNTREPQVNNTDELQSVYTREPQVYVTNYVCTSETQGYDTCEPQVNNTDEPQTVCTSEPQVYVTNYVCTSETQVYDTSEPRVNDTDEPQSVYTIEPQIYVTNYVCTSETQGYDTSEPQVNNTDEPQTVCPSDPQVYVTNYVCTSETQVYDTSEPRVNDTNEPQSVCTSEPQVYNTSAPQVYSTSVPEVYCTNESQSVCESQEYDTSAPQVYSNSSPEPQSICTSEPQVYGTNKHQTIPEAYDTSAPEVCEAPVYWTSESRIYYTTELQYMDKYEDVCEPQFDDDYGQPDEDGITFGFDINEQLLGGPTGRPRCDLVRDAIEVTTVPSSETNGTVTSEPNSPPEPAGADVRANSVPSGAESILGGVAVLLSCAALRYVAPRPPADTTHLHQIIDYVGTAWDDVLRCGSGKVRYFNE